MNSNRLSAPARSFGFASAATALALLAGGCQVEKAYDRQQGGTVSAAPAPVASGSAAASVTTAPARTLTPQERQVEDYAKLGYRLEWIGYATVMKGQQVKMASVLGDLIAVQDTSNALTALNTRDGTARFSQIVDSAATNLTGLARAGGAVVVTGESSVFLLDSDNGTIVDRQRLARVANTPPAVLGELLVFGTSTGSVIAHDVRSGMRPWGYMINGPVQFEPVVIGSTGVGAISSSGQVLMLDASSGTLLGSNQMFGGVAAKPAADNDTLYVASLDQSLYAYSARGGGVRWRVRTEEPLRGEPVVHAGSVYVQMPGGFSALDTASGKSTWANPDVRGVLALVNPQGRGVVWDGSTATTLDLKTGQVVDRIALPAGSLLKPERFSGGVLYVITPRGQVIKLAPRA